MYLISPFYEIFAQDLKKTKNPVLLFLPFYSTLLETFRIFFLFSSVFLKNISSQKKMLVFAHVDPPSSIFVTEITQI